MLAPTPQFTLWTRDLRPGVGPNATVHVVDKGSTAWCWPQRHNSRCGQGIYGLVLAPTSQFTLWTRDLRPGVGPNITNHVVDKGSTAWCWPQHHNSRCGQGIYDLVLAPTRGVTIPRESQACVPHKLQHSNGAKDGWTVHAKGRADCAC